MHVELKHIKGGELEQEYSCRSEDFPEVAALAEDGIASYRDPIHFLLRFQQSGRIVDVSGQFNAVLDLTCGRCLSSYEHLLSDSFSLTFAPQTTDDVSADERKLEKDELGLVPYVDERLELKEPLQEQLLMAIPIRPLCSEQCRGLCPECGADLNQHPCDCERKPFNNKFGVLTKIKP